MYLRKHWFISLVLIKEIQFKFIELKMLILQKIFILIIYYKANIFT